MIEYGRGKRNRSKPAIYEPVMTGQIYPVWHGLNNLWHRENRYALDEVVPSSFMLYKVGVINLNTDTQLQLETPDEGLQDNNSLTEYLLGVILVQQNNLKTGLELFGDRAEEATTKEFQQIHDFGMHGLQVQDTKTLSRAKKMKPILAHMFIIKKRNGIIKARKCAVGSKQQKFPGYDKSLTVSLDGVIITSTIEAHQEDEVAVVDLSNAFLNAFNNEQTLMLLKGKLTELMIQIDPN